MHIEVARARLARINYKKINQTLSFPERSGSARPLTSCELF